MNILTVLPAWLWILISALFFACGEFLSKKFTLNPGWLLFLIFIVVDALSAITWLPALFEKNKLSTTGVVWSLVSLMATVAIGVLVFDEKITFVQSLGLATGLISITLLSW